MRPLLAWLARSNVFWSGLEAAVSAGLSCVSAFVIARIIGPDELGVAAAAVAAHVLFWVAVNALFADAIVQRAELDDAMVSSAFWASLGVGCVAGVAQLGAGRLLAWLLGDVRLLAMSALLACALPLVGAAGPVQGRLTRERAYRTLAARTIVGQGLGTLLGVGAALAGAGAWAMVLQQCVVSVAGALALLLGASWRPLPVCRRRDVAALLRVGLPLTANTLVQQGRYRLFALLIGVTAGPAALGQVHLAFRLVDSVRDLLLTALWRLMLPVMAARQSDPAALLACVDRLLARVGLVLFPVCAAMFLTVSPLVALLLGPVWFASGDAAQPLVGLMAYVLLGFPAGVAGVARGQPKYALLTNLAGLAATLLGGLVFRPDTPGEAIAVWAGAQVLTGPYGLAMNARLLGVGVLRPLRAGLPALAASAVAAAVALMLSAWSGLAGAPASLIALRLGVAALVLLGLVLLGLALLARWPWALRARGAAGVLLALAPGARAQPYATYFPEGVPGYDTNRGVTVLSRLRPEYEGPGLRWGSLLLRPALEQGAGYDSNAVGTRHPVGGWGEVTRPSLLVGSDWSRDSFGAYLGVDDRRYANLASQNQTNVAAYAGGGIDIGRDRLTLGASHVLAHQNLTDLDAFATDRPVAYQVDDARISYRWQLNRLSITPDIGAGLYRYDATTILGAPAPQAYRNRALAAGGVSLRYELAPDRHLLFVARATDTRYTEPQAGAPSRDGTGYLMLAGVGYDYDGVWRYHLLLGWESRSFAAAQYASHAAPVAEAGLTWTPTGLTTVAATLSRSIEDASQEGVAGYTLTNARLRVDHEYLRDVLLRARAAVQSANYTQGGGAQAGFSLGVGVTWLLDRNVRITAAYDFSVQQGAPSQVAGGSPAAGGYARNVFLLSVRFAL